MPESNLILVKGCLLDKDMTLFDHKNKTRKIVDWGYKDRQFGQIRGALKQKASSWELWSEHIIPEFTPISNQFNIGSCVANAWCDMLEILDGLEGTDVVEQLSRLFLYWLARYLHGDTHLDEGTFLRSAAYQLRKVGVVLEKDFPYELANVFPKQVDLDLYTMASNNRIEGFYRLVSYGKQLADEIELAVRTNHPVVFGTPVSEDFKQYRGGGDVFSRPANDVGRHAMIIVGVRYVNGERQFLLRNSWGKDWGEDGHAWVTEDYITWDETQDMWVGTRMLPLAA